MIVADFRIYNDTDKEKIKKRKKFACYEIKYYLCGEEYKMTKQVPTGSKEFANPIAAQFAEKSRQILIIYVPV